MREFSGARRRYTGYYGKFRIFRYQDVTGIWRFTQREFDMTGCPFCARSFRFRWLLEDHLRQSHVAEMCGLFLWAAGQAWVEMAVEREERQRKARQAVFAACRELLKSLIQKGFLP
jgi:hypothetical protein